MTTIPDQYNKNGWAYRLLKRDGNYAIYEQPGEGRSWYELVRIRHRAERTFNETTIPAGEYLPSDNDWGTHGWTFGTLEEAVKAMDAKRVNGLTSK